MTIGVIAALMGLLLGSAAIIIPRLVNRRNDPADNADSRAYLAETGRSAESIAHDNQDQPSWPGNDAGSGQAGASGPGKTS